MRQTILEEIAESSVMINGLLIPASALETRLHSHAFNLVVHDDDPIYNVRLVGSATAVFFRADGRSTDPALLRVRATPPLDFEPNGMSGGSAFVVLSTRSGYQGYFSGIVLRGGREFFHVLSPCS